MQKDLLATGGTVRVVVFVFVPFQAIASGCRRSSSSAARAGSIRRGAKQVLARDLHWQESRRRRVRGYSLESGATYLGPVSPWGRHAATNRSAKYTRSL